MSLKNMSIADILKLAVTDAPPAAAETPPAAEDTTHKGTELIQLLETYSSISRQFHGHNDPIKVVNNLSGVINGINDKYQKSGGKARNVAAVVASFNESADKALELANAIKQQLEAVSRALNGLNSMLKKTMDTELQSVVDSAQKVVAEMNDAWKDPKKYVETTQSSLPFKEEKEQLDLPLTEGKRTE